MNVTVDSLSWMDAAACAGLPPSIFFGRESEQQHEKPAREAAAKRVCACCPVRVACLEDALAGGIRFGVFGGTGEDERGRLRENLRRRTRAAERRAS